MKSIELNTKIISLLDKVSSGLKNMGPKDPYDDDFENSYCIPSCSVVNGIWRNTKECGSMAPTIRAREYYNQHEKGTPGFKYLDKDTVNDGIVVPRRFICKKS